MSQPPAKPRASTPTNTPQAFWEYGDLGFDTGKKLWFIQFFNETNQSVGSYYAKSVTLRKGRAIQYQWKDTQGRPFWHVRERFFADEIDAFSVDPAGAIAIDFKEEAENPQEAAAPDDYAYVLYAYHLSNREDGKAPTGFVEFFNAKGESIRRINNRWIIIEGADRRTVGEFPKIRLRADRSDITNILVTRSAIILQGKRAEKQK